jgi:hypothetical protein
LTDDEKDDEAEGRLDDVLRLLDDGFFDAKAAEKTDEALLEVSALLPSSVASKRLLRRRLRANPAAPEAAAPTSGVGSAAKPAS